MCVWTLPGRVGRNVAAGMTGGLAYILDEDNTLIPKVCVKNLFSIFPPFLVLVSRVYEWTLSLGFSFLIRWYRNPLG